MYSENELNELISKIKVKHNISLKLRSDADNPAGEFGGALTSILESDNLSEDFPCLLHIPGKYEWEVDDGELDYKDTSCGSYEITRVC